jgi:hypothetical protein
MRGNHDGVATLNHFSLRILLVLVEHAANAYARADNSIDNGKGITPDHEFAGTLDLSGPTNFRVGLQPEGASPNLGDNPISRNLAVVSVEILDGQQVIAGTR